MFPPTLKRGKALASALYVVWQLPPVSEATTSVLALPSEGGRLRPPFRCHNSWPSQAAQLILVNEEQNDTQHGVGVVKDKALSPCKVTEQGSGLD